MLKYLKIILISTKVYCQDIDCQELDDIRSQLHGQSLTKTQAERKTEDRLITIFPYPVEVQTSKTTFNTFGKKSTERTAPQIVKKKARFLPSDKTKVIQVGDWPNSVNGVVESTYKDGRKTSATGTLIGPNVALTAGHALYDHKRNEHPIKIQFIPAIDVSLQFSGMSPKVIQKFISSEYVQSGTKEDYGLLILDQLIGNLLGYFGLSVVDPEILKRKLLSITGYPKNAKIKTHEMWKIDGVPLHIDADYIFHVMDTAFGQSGSAVSYQETDGNFFIVGVHVLKDVFANKATFLTKKRYQQIKEWIHDIAITDITAQKDTRYLSLRKEQIGNYGVRFFSQCTNIRSMTSLNLAWNAIEDIGAQAIAQSPFLSNLTSLKLGWNLIKDSGVEAIAQSPYLSKLTYLDLWGNYIQDRGIKAIAQSPYLSKLTYLDLGFNKIGQGGAEEISRSPHLSNVTTNLTLNPSED